MANTPRKSYKDIINVSTADDLGGDSPVGAKVGAEKEPGVSENGITAVTPEEIVTIAPPRAHFYYVRANDDASEKNMTGDERCGGFESFKQKLYPEVFGEKVGPVENAEVAFVNGKPKFLGRAAVGVVEFTANIDNAVPLASGGGFEGGGAPRSKRLEESIMSKGAVEAAGAFLMKTEFDIEGFETYVLIDKCMNVGNLAADMVDFTRAVYGGEMAGLWMAYIPDAGEFSVVGGDDFRGKSVLLINWTVERVMMLIDAAAAKGISQPFWLVDFVDPLTKEREIHISDRGVYLGLYGLSPSLQRTYGERIDSAVVKLMDVTGNLMTTKTIYVTMEGLDSASDYRKGTLGGATLDALFNQAGLTVGKVRQARTAGIDLRNTGVVALLVPVSANARHSFEQALTKWDAAAGDASKGGFCVTNGFDGFRNEISVSRKPSDALRRKGVKYGTADKEELLIFFRGAMEDDRLMGSFIHGIHGPTGVSPR